MRIPKRLAAALTGAAIATMALSGLASASHPNGYSLFGDAEYVSPGNASNRAVQIRSDADSIFGGIDFEIAAGTTFADLTQLSTDFMPQDALDDFCLGGSPRFQINLDSDDDDNGIPDNIHAYFGIDSAGAPCLPGWQNTGDQLEINRLVDTSQLTGGTFYDPYALALTKYGEYVVTGIQVVVDAAWAHLDNEQTFIIDNTSMTIDGDVHLYTYEVPQPESKDDCKKGGWRDLAREDGTPFRNQGDCIQYANTGR